MCLLSIDKRASKRKIGYKVFHKKGKSYYTGLTSEAYRTKFKLGEWVSDPVKSQGYTYTEFGKFFDKFGVAIATKIVRGFSVCFYKSDAFGVLQQLRNWPAYDNPCNDLVVCKVETDGTFCSGLTNWAADFHPKTIVVNKCRIICEV